jgi:DNA invertase Pin-like site-specific DNA recombinase
MSHCLYLRKSRADLDAEARGEGETLARHEKALLELGKRQKLNITQIYREIVSGETIAARPVMQQLLSEVEQGAWDGVLVMEVERLARGDTIDQGIVAQTFKLSDTKIITPMKTYDPNNEYDEEYFEFGLFMSRREYKTINRRLQRGRIASVKEGKYVGNKSPYGYVRKKLEHEKGFTLDVDPEQAPIVKMIFDLYAHGERQADGTLKEMGVAKIVRKLNNLGIPTVKGDVWVNATLQNMLRNPVYIGKIRWSARPMKKRMVDGQMIIERPRAKEADWIMADGLHEALVDDKTWNEVQQHLHANPSTPCPKEYQVKNPLSGLVVCGMCGRKMVRRPYTNSNYPDTLMCAVTSCNNISSQLDYVEERVLQSLQQWLNNYKLAYGKQPAAAPQTSIKKKALKNTQAELKSLEKQRDSIYDLLEKGIYTTDVFLERSQSINDKISELKESMNVINSEIERETLTEQSQKTIIPRAERVIAQYKKVKSPAEKNELLKSVIEKVVYTKTVNGRWHNKPDEFELMLYPKLPTIHTNH